MSEEKNIENPKWICPKCKTENEGKFCSNCACPRPIEKKQEKPKDNRNFFQKNWIAIAVAFVLICVLGMVIPKIRGNSSSSSQALIANFGQEPVKNWTELTSLTLCETVAEFNVEIPENITKEYDEASFNVLSKTGIQVIYKKESGEKVAILKYLGSYDSITNLYGISTTGYQKVEVLTFGNQDYKFYGSDGKVEIVTWENEEYSYSVVTSPMSQEEAEELVQEIK